MKFTAEIDIMPHRELLGPPGRIIANSMKSLDMMGVEEVRIGKHITLLLEAESEAPVTETVEGACKKLLANLIMESYTFKLAPTE